MVKHKAHNPRPVIDVTAEIMQRSLTRNSSHCMIAMAIEEQLPDMKKIAVDISTIRFSDPAKHVRYTYLTPRIAQLAIISFDEGELPEPFSFKLKNAHVSRRSVRPPSKPPREISETKKLVLKKAREVYGGKARLASSETGSHKPRRVGGLPLPETHFAKRREFGVNALHR